MNFYKHHIGDYAQATAHLSFVEDAAYSRMLRKYYAEESALPADVKAVQRLVGARTREERAAVETVLHEFFELREDGWHNKRADAELAEQRDAELDREERHENERERQRRHREERRRLFEQLRAFDIVPAWDTKTDTLRAMVAARRDNAPVTVTETVVSQPVTPPVTRTATANQTPDTRRQTPEKEKASAVPSSGDGTVPGALSRALREHGVLSNPMEPRLIALAEAGITPAQASAAAAEAREAKGQNARIPPAYVYAILERWIAEPATRPAAAHDPVAVANEALRMQEARDAKARAA